MYTVTAYYSLFDLYTIFNPLKKGLISMKTNINRMKEKKIVKRELKGHVVEEHCTIWMSLLPCCRILIYFFGCSKSWDSLFLD